MGNALGPRSLVGGKHQLVSNPTASIRFGDGDRQFRCLLVDESFTVAFRREEPIPDKPNRTAGDLSNQPDIAGPPPPFVEDHHLRMRFVLPGE